ncbi:MAG: phosphogluconate dehydrogenase (NAD(+)-dependent, decarboxylating) [Lachnospirales bacterium]
MKIGIIGLGKMGYNIALNGRDKGHEVIAYNRSKEKMDEIEKEGVKVARTLEDLAKEFGSERKIIWMMIPAGDTIDNMIKTLIPLLNKGDILLDGGNSNFNDTKRRALELEKLEIDFCDVGTSGGMSGARHGACTMIGGKPEVFSVIEPFIKDICVENGYLHCGPYGSGHYVKMIHNGIEYGMMGAIGEGFEILHKSEFDLDYEKVARVWSNGSVIRGWLMELMEEAFKKDGKLDNISGEMYSSGEGLWTVEEALKLQVSASVITASLLERYRSLENSTFTGKSVAALRNGFGGHYFKSTKTK